MAEAGKGKLALAGPALASLDQLGLARVNIRDAKFEPTGPMLGPKSGPAGLLRGMNAMLPGSE